jgi:flagellar hook-associated protein 1 FlgK
MDPPQPVSSDPSSEIIRKLRSQLDAYANMFVARTKPGEPTSLADAYDNADPVKDGELPQHFFIGTDRFTLAVHPSLIDNSKAVKDSAIPAMVVAMNKVGRTLTADGLTATDTSYVGAASAITGNWMTIGKSVEESAETTKASRDLLTERFHNTTGVNIDEEIALLQQLQTSYAASARVMQVATSMYDTLEAILR